MDELPITKRLQESAKREAMVSRAIAEAKTERNRAAGDEYSNYAGVDENETLPAKAAALIREMEAALVLALGTLVDCAPHEQGVIQTGQLALAKAREA